MPVEYDFIGVGLGPFNLGLACLSQPLSGLKSLFLEQKSHFNWHPGMLLPNVTVQTPFLCDLVTMADPTSKFSFLNYLKQSGRIYSFYIREDFNQSRREYSDYCNWAASQLRNIRFGQTVKYIEYDEGGQRYIVHVYDMQNERNMLYHTRRLVLGTGTQPFKPSCGQGLTSNVCHSAQYVYRKNELKDRKSIVIIGSGQSAAEIYYDLLQDIDRHSYTLNWITRSPRYFPLDLSKLTLEMTSPDYTDYFHRLPEAKRLALLKEQKSLYKGINQSLIAEIYKLLCEHNLTKAPKTRLMTGSELVDMRPLANNQGYDLHFQHLESDQAFRIESEAVIFATGYHYREPDFLQPVRDRIRFTPSGAYDVDRFYSIDVRKGEIFVQNAELHSHGFVASDLGMGCYRNACILSQICGEDVYKIEKRIAFQDFGIPADLNTFSDTPMRSAQIVS